MTFRANAGDASENDAARAPQSGDTARAPRRRGRAAFVIDWHWEAVIGGAQYQAGRLLELLLERGDVDVDYVSRFVPRNLERAGYRIVPFGKCTSRGRLRMLLDLPSLYRTLRRLGPRVVYQRCLTPFTGACAWYCRRHGAKLVYHIASDRDVGKPLPFKWAPHGLLQWLAHRIGLYGLRRADIIVAQTEQQAKTLRAEHGIDASLVVRNFHPVPEMRLAGTRHGRARVIWVANFKPFKRPDIFADLAEALSHRKDVDFVMIGRPGPPERFAALHARIARTGNLRYLGELPIERVEEEIAASDLFVNTSLHEGFPNTFIQAWLRGVPVVSCFVDPDGCLSSGGAGVHAGGEQRLVEVVENLLDDRARLRALGLAARDYALAHHSPSGARPLVELLAAAAGTRHDAGDGPADGVAEGPVPGGRASRMPGDPEPEGASIGAAPPGNRN